MSNTSEKQDQTTMAAKAMALKEAGAAPTENEAGHSADGEGFKNIPRPDYPPSGAFDAEGHRPVLERSRKER